MLPVNSCIEWTCKLVQAIKYQKSWLFRRLFSFQLDGLISLCNASFVICRLHQYNQEINSGKTIHILAYQWSRFDTQRRTFLCRHLQAKRLFIMCTGKKTLINAAFKGFESPLPSFIFLFWYRFPNYWFGMDNCCAFMLAMDEWEERSRVKEGQPFGVSFACMCTVKTELHRAPTCSEWLQ